MPPGISFYLLVPNPKPDVFQVIWQKCIRAEHQNVVSFALKLTVAHHVFLRMGRGNVLSFADIPAFPDY